MTENLSQEPSRDFVPLNVAVMTVSDSRTEETDKSGKLLAGRLSEAGHQLFEKTIVRDDIYDIRACLSLWITASGVQVVLITGGTGLTGRDGTPEAVRPLLDKEIPGFGELFRVLSYDAIGTSSLQSRALAGVANGTIVFCLPGSSAACVLAWDSLIQHQLDFRTRPCNLAELLPRLRESAPAPALAT